MTLRVFLCIFLVCFPAYGVDYLFYKKRPPEILLGPNAKALDIKLTWFGPKVMAKNSEDASYFNHYQGKGVKSAKAWKKIFNYWQIYDTGDKQTLFYFSKSELAAMSWPMRDFIQLSMAFLDKNKEKWRGLLEKHLHSSFTWSYLSDGHLRLAKQEILELDQAIKKWIGRTSSSDLLTSLEKKIFLTSLERFSFSRGAFVSWKRPEWSLEELRAITKNYRLGLRVSMFWYPLLEGRMNKVELMMFTEQSIKLKSIVNKEGRVSLWPLRYYLPISESKRGEIYESILKKWGDYTAKGKESILLSRRELEEKWGLMRLLENEKYLGRNFKRPRRPYFKTQRDFFHQLLRQDKAVVWGRIGLFLIGDTDALKRMTSHE